MLRWIARFSSGAPALHTPHSSHLYGTRHAPRDFDSVVMMVPDATSTGSGGEMKLSFPCCFPPYRPYLSVLHANPPGMPLLSLATWKKVQSFHLCKSQSTSTHRRLLIAACRLMQARVTYHPSPSAVQFSDSDLSRWRIACYRITNRVFAPAGSFTVAALVFMSTMDNLGLVQNHRVHGPLHVLAREQGFHTVQSTGSGVTPSRL